MSTNPDTNPELVDTFQRLLRDYYHEDVLELAQHYPTQRALTVDWMDLYRVDSELAIDLVESPDKILPSANEALRQYDIPVDVGFGKASIRFTNLRQEVDITDLGRNQYNNSLVAVRGQVTQLSKIRQQAEELVFECQRCGTITRIPQNGAAGIQEPHECQGCERRGPFMVNHGQSEYRDHQLVRIQKPPEGGNGAGRKIDVALTNDQVTSISDRDQELSEFFQVGDKLSLGIKQEIGDQVEGTDLYETQYLAHSYTVENSTFEDLDIDEHLDRIKAIANGEYGDPFDLLVASINPDHYGDEKIKLAIGLQMFGGWAKTTPSGSRERGDIHILLLGDPGSGKSTFLEVAKSIVPRSVKA
ncbi:MAG: ATP-dependent DNA helicase, partial [archaeon]